MTALSKLPRILGIVLLSLVLLVCGCLGAFRWLGYETNKPPEISAEYESGEAFLVMEDLAGELIAEVSESTGSSPFASRSWTTTTCASGWDDKISWYGFVSATVSYEFAWPDADDVTSIDYGEHIAAAIESIGMEPEVESKGQKTVHAERDDGLEIDFYSNSGLHISTDCVVEGGPYVYTPPHGNVAPAHDSQDLNDD